MRRARGFGLAASLVCIAVQSCSDEPTRPRDPQLLVEVRSAAGDPVAGAKVTVRYALTPEPAPAPAAPLAQRPRALPTDIPGVPPPSVPRVFSVSNNPCTLGTATILLGIPRASQSTITVLDRARSVRRTLADRAFAAGLYTIAWDGRDDFGRGLEPGVYTVAWTDIEGDSVFRFSAKVLWQPFDIDLGALGVTSAPGTFSIPISELPIGERIEWIDQLGVSHGVYVIAPSLVACAKGEVGSVLRSACSPSVSIEGSGRDVRVTISLP